MSDAMAIGMITAPHAVTVSPVATEHAALDASVPQDHAHSGAGNGHECSGLAVDTSANEDGTAATECGSPVALGCESCSTCQACHSVALVADSHSIALLLPKVAPVGELPHIASIEPQPGLKPPIF